jgi:hypothetical protein
VTRFVPQNTLAMGGVGAVIGGAAAAAKNIRRVKDDEINGAEAVKNTIKEAAGTGLATATATVVVGALGATGFFSLAGFLSITTGAKYVWDSVTAFAKSPASLSKQVKSKKESKSKG